MLIVSRRHSHNRHWLVVDWPLRFNSFNKLLSKRPFIIDDIFRRSSPLEINLETTSNKIFVTVGHMNFRLEQFFNRSSGNFVVKNRLYFLFPRQMSEDHLKGNNTETPDITLERVTIELQSLRRHVVGRTHIVVKLLLTFL